MGHTEDIENLRHGRRVVGHSIIILCVLTAIKAWGGYVTNMLALLGDAAGSFIDFIAAIAIFIGLTLSMRPPSKQFKYGYHRIETLVSLLISIFITYVGFKILLEAINRIKNPAPTQLAAIGVVAASISIVLSIISYVIQKRTAEQINSSALMTSAIDKRNDAVVSFGVLVGVIANGFDIPYVENAVGIVVAVLVLLLGINAAKDALLYLLDYWDDPQLSKKINQIVNASPLVIGLKKIRLRHAGTFIFGEAFAQINPFADTIDIRNELHRLNREIKTQIPHLGDFIIYIDPPKPELIRVAIPVREDRGLESIIADDLKEPFHIMILNIQKSTIADYTVDASHTFTVPQSALIAAYLKTHHVNIFIANNIQALLYFTLRLANIKTYPHFGNVKNVSETVKLLLLDL
ncbi:MAG: cation diffusion facilitator family transporter [Patescibacteria group bacterium]